MRIALVVPPFITVPPQRYGGTELFVAQLAQGLLKQGHQPVVYTVGDSTVACETRWRVHHGRWPIESPLESSLDDLEHSAWACQDAAGDCDVIHVNNAPGLNYSRFVRRPFIYTLHHPHEPALSRYYQHFPQVRFVGISHNQARLEHLSNLSVIHHGLDLSRYKVADGRRDYLCFIGRIADIKGTHTAIAVARRAGLPLKIAGEIQPIYRDYYDRQVRPHLGGEIEYVGEVNLEQKNALLAGARALLFPIEWDEPFGLVMIEAMACGVPVLAFGRGSVPEIVADGVSGWLCRDAADMARRAVATPIAPASCRAYVREKFSVERMASQYLEIYQASALKPLAPRRPVNTGAPPETASPLTLAS